MSELPRRSESYTSQRRPRLTRMPWITWVPRVTAVATFWFKGLPPGGGSRGMATDQTLARAVYTAYASDRVSPARAMVFAPRPVVRRAGAPRGFPAEERSTT